MVETPITDQPNTQQYLILGTISAIISVILIPLAGLVSIYSSYKIHGKTRKIYTYLIGGIGAFSVFFWIAYMMSI
ncbi:hypothetical protein ABSL23_15740 (plasmid) [Halobacterium sp. NMX12-1]|uniref:Uncharacterized protein n=1 Tax=Halobacterium sp. NMX12-1 TaxID=3166650 RepID=A0AAU8CIH7_9EURY